MKMTTRHSYGFMTLLGLTTTIITTILLLGVPTHAFLLPRTTPSANDNDDTTNSQQQQQLQQQQEQDGPVVVRALQYPPLDAKFMGHNARTRPGRRHGPSTLQKSQQQQQESSQQHAGPRKIAVVKSSSLSSSSSSAASLSDTTTSTTTGSQTTGRVGDLPKGLKGRTLLLGRRKAKSIRRAKKKSKFDLSNLFNATAVTPDDYEDDSSDNNTTTTSSNATTTPPLSAASKKGPHGSAKKDNFLAPSPYYLPTSTNKKKEGRRRKSPKSCQTISLEYLESLTQFSVDNTTAVTPIYDSVTGENIGFLTSTRSSAIPITGCIVTSIYGFGFDENGIFVGDDQIFTLGSCNMATNAIWGGTGKYACATGTGRLLDVVAIENDLEASVELSICGDTC